MNRRYRKVMRMKSRHARHGHTSWCRCPEVWEDLILAIQRRDYTAYWASFPRRKLGARALPSP